MNLYQAGFRSAEDVAETSIADLVEVKDIGEDKANKIIESANLYIEEKEQQALDEKEPEEDEALKEEALGEG